MPENQYIGCSTHKKFFILTLRNSVCMSKVNNLEMHVYLFSTSSSCLAAVMKGFSSTISACGFHTASFSSVLCNTRICVTVCQHSNYGQEYTREWVGRTSEPWHWLQHSVRNNFHFAFWYCSECRYIRDGGNVLLDVCVVCGVDIASHPAYLQPWPKHQWIPSLVTQNGMHSILDFSHK